MARSGLAQTQLLILGAVIAVILILGGAGFAIYRSTTRGAEDSATKASIDRVAAAAEDYWQRYAMDRSGRRTVDLLEFCAYANHRFAQEADLTLRTVMWSSDPVAGNRRNRAQPLAGAAAGLARAEGWPASASAAEAAAACPTKLHEISDAGDNHSQNSSAVVTPLDPAYNLIVTSAAAHNADDITLAALQSVGLGGTSGVWMLQPVGLAAGTDLPAGTLSPPASAATAATKSCSGATAATHNCAQNEVLIFGGISPTGTSFCLVKVFDADNRTEIGEYRSAKPATAASPEPTFCETGTSGLDPNGPWPAAS